VSTTRATLTVCMGLPGSGKTTWCRTQPGVVVSADAIRTRKANGRAIFGKMRREAGRALLDGVDVFVDACSLRWRDREPWLTFAREIGARTRLVIIDTDPAECRRRNRARRHPAGRMPIYESRMRDALGRVSSEGWGDVKLTCSERSTQAPSGAQNLGTSEPTGV